MFLTDFMNKNGNWQLLLAAKPYYLEIKQDGNFYILKYNMIKSDMTLPLVCEARGSIFTYYNGEWICVCRSLDKFGNWGEPYAETANIDWSQKVSVQEKIDGSIMRLWYWEGWHLSTNGTINAFKAECGDSTFGDVFDSIIAQHMSVEKFLSILNPSYTYWFEMVHPQYNHIVVHYKEAAISFLGLRKMSSGEEEIPNPKLFPSWVRLPKQFDYENLDDVLRACHEMGEDEEGYVVCAYNQMKNGSFLRIKCKGDEYLRRHKLRGDGPLTAQKIIGLWQNDTIDDFIAYFPEHSKFVDEIIQKLANLIEKADIAYDCVKGHGARRDFALRAQSYIKPIQSYLFARLDNKVDNATTFLKMMRPRNLAQLIDVEEIDT